MRFSPYIFLLLLGCGCITNHKALEDRPLTKKREQIIILQAEIEAITRHIDILQRNLIQRNIYPTVDQTRDLDECIKALREARDKLVAKDKQLDDRATVIHGPE